jgi:uncharacterized membrane protein YbhN (UPF0104 family)
MGRLPSLPAFLRKPPPWSTWPLRLLVLAGLLAYILHDLDLAAVVATLGRLPPWIFPLGIAFMVLGQALQALRWKVLLRNPAVRYLDCLAFTGMGATLAMVSPSSVLADGAVSYWLGRRRHNVVESMSALMTSRIFGVVVMTSICLSLLPSHLWVFREIAFSWAPGKTLFLCIALTVLAGGSYLAYRQRARFGTMLDHALPALRDFRTIALALSISVLAQAGQFLALYLGYLAMDIPIAFTEFIFFWPLISLAGLMPVSIGGIGVRESLAIFFFTLLPGVAKEHVLAHAGYMYALLAGMAGVNGLLAAAVLWRGSDAR